MVDELARRFAQGDVPARLTLRGLSRDQQQALADLLGEDRLRGTTFALPMSRLVAALRVPDVEAVRGLVAELRGPIADRRLLQAAAEEARAELWEWFRKEASGLAPAAWVDGVQAAGARGGVERHRQRLEGAVAALRALPADGSSLAGLADDVLGDPHALDRGRSVTALVLDAVAAMLGRERAVDAESARLLWEAVGVVPDPLSSTVLALGLRPAGDDPLAVWLRALADAGEPAVLTLAQLRRWPVPPLPSGACAYVVENPSLLADASAGGWDGPVLVCSSGRPTVAVVTLLRQLGAAGATLAQHADFDAVGLGITAWLAERTGATPWRMGAADYRAAISSGRARVALAGRLPATPWDPDLGPAMAEAGVAVYEEELRILLLAAMA